MLESLSAGRAIKPDKEVAKGHVTRSDFFERVYALVSQIPEGRVTTYGAIARTLGSPRSARIVGWALNLAPAEEDLPCHRVVDRNGFLSGGWHWGHPDVMAGLLRHEGVPFLEPYRVELAQCLWLPGEDDDVEDGLASARSGQDSPQERATPRPASHSARPGSR